MIMMALAMIGEGLDDGAIADTDTARAGYSDPLEFAFEKAQPGDLVADIAEMRAGDGVGIVAGHVRLVRKPEKRPNALDGEPKIARMLDEGESFAVTATVTPLIAFRALRLRQKTDLLIIPNRLNLDAGLLRKRADRHHALRNGYPDFSCIRHDFSLEAVVTSACRIPCINQVAGLVLKIFLTLRLSKRIAER